MVNRLANHQHHNRHWEPPREAWHFQEKLAAPNEGSLYVHGYTTYLHIHIENGGAQWQHYWLIEVSEFATKIYSARRWWSKSDYAVAAAYLLITPRFCRHHDSHLPSLHSTSERVQQNESVGGFIANILRGDSRIVAKYVISFVKFTLNTKQTPFEWSSCGNSFTLMRWEISNHMGGWVEWWEWAFDYTKCLADERDYYCTSSSRTSSL